MQDVRIICIGKLKEQYWRDACAEYSKRLSAYCRFSVIEIDEHRLPDNPSQAQIEAGLKAEGKNILSKCPAGCEIIAMCIEGKIHSSEQLAALAERSAMSGKSMCFVIGGSFGLSDEVKERAKVKLSMSAMTFPHQLARVMLCEQIYRAFCINNGSKYHK